MAARLGARFSSLGFRLLAPLLLAVAVVLASHAIVSLRTTREHYRAFLTSEVQRSSRLIRRATHDGMLLNRLDDVQATIQRLAAGRDVAAIRVYDRGGAIVLSSNPAEIGRQLPLDARPCSDCHDDLDPGAPPRREAIELTSAGGQEVLRQNSIITNEPTCSAGGCHLEDAGKTVLGVLDVEMSMLPFQEAFATARLQLIGTTLVLLLIVGVVATVMVRHLVLEPVALLHEGTRSIAGGDLDTRIPVKGQHELADLAVAFNGMAEDLSHARDALNEWSRTLEEKVAEKTAELRQAERHVQHVEKMASLGKLAATVAHELNNPLSGVLTYARLVERELAGQPIAPQTLEEIDRHLGLVKRECTRCGKIVNNLLLFARPTHEDVGEVDVDEVVERSLLLVHHHLEIRGIGVDHERSGESAVIVADAGELEQALVALFVNAAEAMPSGGHLSVRVTKLDGLVDIDVEDTGVGIPPDVLPRVFEPFFSTKDETSGVGLGLAVVYGIIHRHGGTIDISSETGRGTTFRITLPKSREWLRTGGEGPRGETVGADPTC